MTPSAALRPLLFTVCVSAPLSLSGCIFGYPIDSVFPADVSWETPTFAGFTVGERYTVRQPLDVWQTGDVLNVGVSPERRGSEAPLDHQSRLPDGTTFRVVAIRRWQTITNGYRYWPEIRIESGGYAGKRMQVEVDREGTVDPSLFARIRRHP